MTFEEAHEKLLGQFDQAVAELRGIHEDRKHLNGESTQCKAAIAKVLETGKDLFRLKQVWSQFED